jgi:hypothetical protein
MNAYLTFDEATINICSYLGDEDGTKYYTRVSRQLMLAINQLNLHLFPNVGVATIVVQDNLTAPLPDDFISMVRIGVCCESKNELIPIDYNGKLCPKPAADFKLDCCECTKTLDEEGNMDEDKSQFCDACSVKGVGLQGGHRRFGNYYYSYLYGVSSDYKEKGTYKIDEKNGQLIFGQGCYVQEGSELVLEYSSSMSSADYLRIPSQAMIALQHRVAFFLYSQPQKREYEDKKFRREYRLLKRLLSRYTLNDFVNSVRSSYKSSIKQ